MCAVTQAPATEICGSEAGCEAPILRYTTFRQLTVTDTRSNRYGAGGLVQHNVRIKLVD